MLYKMILFTAAFVFAACSGSDAPEGLHAHPDGPEVHAWDISDSVQVDGGSIIFSAIPFPTDVRHPGYEDSQSFSDIFPLTGKTYCLRDRAEGVNLEAIITAWETSIIRNGDDVATNAVVTIESADGDQKLSMDLVGIIPLPDGYWVDAYVTEGSCSF